MRKKAINLGGIVVLKKYQPIKRQNCHQVDTNQLIYSANQLTGFYIMATLTINELINKTTKCNISLLSRQFYPRFWHTNFSIYILVGLD